MGKRSHVTEAEVPAAHRRGVQRLQQSYQRIPPQCSVRLAKPTSNLFRARTKPGAPGLDTSGLTGVIAVDPNGKGVMEFNSPGMFRGMRDSSGQRQIAIYEK